MYIRFMNSLRNNLFGESVFTSFRTQNSMVQGLRVHIERLYRDFAMCYGLEEVSYLEFCEEIINPLNLQEKMSANENAYFRVTIFSLEEAELKKTEFNLRKFQVDLMIKDLPASLSNEAGSLMLSPSPYGAGFINCKMGSYAQNLIYKRLAISNGYTDTLFFNENNEVLELTTSNIIFFEKNSIIFVQGLPIFHGITEALLKKFLELKNFPYENKKIKLKDIHEGLSGFCLNSVQGIKPIERIGSTRLHLIDLDILSKFNKSFLESCYE